MRRLCRYAARELASSGVGISLTAPSGPTLVAASDSGTEILEQLQFTLGEGPCQDCSAGGRPVLVSDLTEAGARWPGFTPAMAEHQVAAVFAFPLQLGAARLGAMTVYRGQLGLLRTDHLARAVTLAEAAMSLLMEAQEAGEQRRPVVQLASEDRLEVYQAQGMVQVQLGVDLTEAMLRLRAYAYSHERPVTEVAADVVARRLVFEPDD